MKFEYEERKDDRECVAWITTQGNLMFSEKQENGKRITICKCGDVHSEGVDPFGPVHKFYPGDKLTITF